MKNKPLSRLRVLDFTWVLAGPYATRMLSDFGAEVIKVQCKKTASGVEDNLTGYFNNWNRNKLSITLDLSYQKAREMILELVKISDVVIENFSPRVMSNWGLDYKTLIGVKPDLIMMSMSAMGQTGPWKDYVAYGHTLHALSGLTHLTSLDKENPTGLGYAYSDFVSGLYATIEVLAALAHRDKSGQGQSIDFSEYEALCSLLGPSLMAASVSGQDIHPYPYGKMHGHIRAAPYGCYRCKGEDRWCVIAIYDEEEWQSFISILGNPDLKTDARYKTVAKRQKHKKELDTLISQYTMQHSAEDIAAILQGSGIAAGVVQNAKDLSRDPQLNANDYFVRLNHSDLGETISERSPVRLLSDSVADWKAAPLLGEHNRYVFLELLGLTEEELETFTREGIIG